MFKKGDCIRRVGGLGVIFKIVEFKEYVDLHQESLTVLLRLNTGKTMSVPTMYIEHDGWELVNEEEAKLIEILGL